MRCDRLKRERACLPLTPTTSTPTRKCAGALPAATTRSSPSSSRCWPSWACRERNSSSSPASAAPAGCPITSIPSASTPFPAGPRRLRPGSRKPARSSVWVVTGDGDGLGHGLNSLMHALRRNVDLKVLLFNNEVHGLSKGQFSPTSRLGTRTRSSPHGSAEPPLRPLDVALTAGATFVARTIDVDGEHLAATLRPGGSAPRIGVRRDLPELQDLQRRRVRLRHRPHHQGRQRALPGARSAAGLRQGSHPSTYVQWFGPGDDRIEYRSAHRRFAASRRARAGLHPGPAARRAERPRLPRVPGRVPPRRAADLRPRSGRRPSPQRRGRRRRIVRQ